VTPRMRRIYKKIRFFLRFLAALVAKYQGAILIGILLGSLTFVLLPRIVVATIQFRSTYSIAYVARPTLSDLPLDIQRQISLGLTHIDSRGQPQPALASSWTATDSGKTYTFILQPGLKWHDGTPVKSSQITYQFTDAQISYPDSNSLTIRLTDPFSPLPVVLSQPIFKTKLVGVGSYKTTSIRKNGNYIDSITLSPINPDSRLPRLRYYFYPSEKLARTAYKLGIVNSIADISDPEDLSDWPNTSVSQVTRTDRYVAAFFNTQSQVFSGSGGKSLRQALAYTTDKTRWPNDSRITGPLSATNWAYTSDIKKYDLDVARARSLLGKSGPNLPKIILSTFPAYLTTAEELKSDWETLGLEIEISVTPDVPDDFLVLVAAQVLPTDPDQYHLWHSTQASNLTRFSHPRIDKLLEDGRKTSDPKERLDIYQDFQKALVEEVPAIFLYHPQSYTITRRSSP